MSYEVGGKVFGTLAEAMAYAEMVRKGTGYILAVTESKRKPTHRIG